MQRFEVSGAVRLIYKSLGVKRLTSRGGLCSVDLVIFSVCFSFHLMYFTLFFHFLSFFLCVISFSSPCAEDRACAVSCAPYPNRYKLLSCQSITQPRHVTRCWRRVLPVSAAVQPLHPDASQLRLIDVANIALMKCTPRNLENGDHKQR